VSGSTKASELHRTEERKGQTEEKKRCNLRQSSHLGETTGRQNKEGQKVQMGCPNQEPKKIRPGENRKAASKHSATQYGSIGIELIEELQLLATMTSRPAINEPHRREKKGRVTAPASEGGGSESPPRPEGVDGDRRRKEGGVWAVSNQKTSCNRRS